MSPAAECVLLDVGHGASTAVLLPGRHVVLIDTGPKSAYRSVLRPLALRSAERLTLVLTHSHRDHCGSAVKLLQDFTGEIESVWLPDDDAADGSLIDAFCDALGTEAARILNRLEANSTSDCGILDDISLTNEDRVVFAILSPRMTVARAIQRQETGNDCRNAGSGIIRIDRRNGDTLQARLLVGGDADLERWEEIADVELADADLLVVPHHGGVIKGNTNAWTRLCGLVQARHVYFSVATKSTAEATKHPRPEAVTAFCDAGSRVFCSQLTHGCCDDPQAFAENPKGGVPCSSHQRVYLMAGGAEFPDAKNAAARVDAVAASDGGRPLCRTQLQLGR